MKFKKDKKGKSGKEKCKEKDDGSGALFIPAGVLLGFGFGFLFGNVPAGMFLGLGAGFTAFAIVELIQGSFKKIIEFFRNLTELEKMESINKKSSAKAQKGCYCKIEDKGCSGIFYFLGFVGAAVYYISTAVGFWAGVLGFLKAIVWPAFLVLELLKFMGI